MYISFLYVFIFMGGVIFVVRFVILEIVEDMGNCMCVYEDFKLGEFEGWLFLLLVFVIM